MIYDKKNDYPDKYLSYVGNKFIIENYITNRDCRDFYWDKDGIEDWIIPYYLSWQGYDYDKFLSEC